MNIQTTKNAIYNQSSIEQKNIWYLCQMLGKKSKEYKLYIKRLDKSSEIPSTH
jgi:hypothetical protein